MGGLEDVFAPRRDSLDIAPGSVSYDGTVSDAPASVTDTMLVTIDGIDGGEHEYGPCPWGPERAAGLPAVGDRVLVAFSDNGEPWVTMWWPT